MRKLLPFVPVLLVLASAAALIADPPTQVTLQLQRRGEDGRTIRQSAALDPAKTAVVVIDMWDRHWCATYTNRVANLVPRMNRTLEAARKLGIPVVFAPSDVVAFYKDCPERKAIEALPVRAAPPKGPLPPLDPPGGRDCCECGPDRPCKPRAAWTRQHPDLKILPGDLIGDCNNAQELLNLCQTRGIKTLVYMGVASNMCVLHRAMGMINMKRHGYEVLFVSDLVEAITGNGYDPTRKCEDPNFTPAKGSDLVRRHLEAHGAPSIESRQLIAAAGLDPHRNDPRPHLAMVIAEDEYQTDKTLPEFARKRLEKDFRTSFVLPKPGSATEFTSLDPLYDADLVVLSVRRRFPPVTQMDVLERYLRSEKPLVVIRVSCAPFASFGSRPKLPPGHVVWQRFDEEVLGCNYQTYDPQARKTGSDVWLVPEAAGHPILKGVEPVKFHTAAWIYRLRPLAPSATTLLMGRWPNAKEPEPVAWTNTAGGRRVFYTCLGHPDDFKLEPFNRLLENAIRWAAERK